MTRTDDALPGPEERPAYLNVAHPLFDAEWYLAQYPDVLADGIDPWEHYCRHGIEEGRDPNRFFDTDWYCSQNPAAGVHGINPLDHYMNEGAAAGKDPSVAFDTRWYLNEYPDVAEDGLNPLLHYLRHGQEEGRSPRAEPKRQDSGRSGRKPTPSEPDHAVSAREAGRLDPSPERRDATASVLYLLPTSSGGGGVHSVVQEARGLRGMGLDCELAVPTEHLVNFLRDYPPADGDDESSLFRAFDSMSAHSDVSELSAYAGRFDCVIATIYHSVELLRRLKEESPGIQPFYYIQDYEPWFFEEGSANWLIAHESYEVVPDATGFAKTTWLASTVEERHDTVVATVTPSIDHAVFRPPDAPRPARPVRVAAMIRPSSLYRGAPRTMRLLKRLTDSLSGSVEVRIFGCRDAELATLETSFPFVNEGPLRRDEVADTLRWASVFIDLSDWQAFGRTGAEAMACGCAVVMPISGGASDFVRHKRNGLLVDTTDDEACLDAVRQLVLDPKRTRVLGEVAQRDMSWYTVDRASRSIEAVLTNAVRSRHVRASAIRKDWSPTNGDHGLVDLVVTEPVSQAEPERESSQPSTDIIVCVHNAPEDVRACIEALVDSTESPFSLIIVDDGSADETRRLVDRIGPAAGARVIRNAEARGYTFAANQGLRASEAPFVVLLNSDTIVTKGWLSRLHDCFASDDTIGLVGPLSNSATWQSVPEIISNGRWANNHGQADVPADETAELVRSASGRVYPRATFLNGFCLMIRREVIADIGIFDEEAFGRGYGEENDYCLRAREQGWELAIADDCYVFHQGSRSYTPERKAELTPLAGQSLARKHGQDVIRRGTDGLRHGRELEGIRARVRTASQRSAALAAGRSRFRGRRVAWTLATRRQGGGANTIILLASVMRRMGVDARLINFEFNREGFRRAYPNLEVPVDFLRGPEEIVDATSRVDMAFATLFESVSWFDYQSSSKHPVRAYYIQDFEPWFFPAGSARYQEAWDSYDVYDDLVRLATTEWVASEVEANTGLLATPTGPLLDIDTFRPRRRMQFPWPMRPIRVTAMIRPSTPRRNAYLTLAVLSALSREYGRDIEVVTFGCSDDELREGDLETSFAFTNMGAITSTQVARLMNECDIFVDLSSWQAMGLTALEAMACGVAVVVPRQGGATEIVTDRLNGLVVDPASFGDCLGAVRQLVENEALRSKIQLRAIRDATLYYPEAVALRLLEAAL